MPIIRNLLLAVGAVMLIPAPPEETAGPAAGLASSPGFIAAASQTVADLSDFCLRQPGVCETAHYVAGKLELKAKYGVRILYEWANEAGSDLPPPGPAEADATQALMTGSLRLADAPPAEGALTAGDVEPPWRQPAPETES